MDSLSIFWGKYGFPTALILGQSLLTLVVLLIFIAYVLFADRKIWAAVQLRRGPNVVGPLGLLQILADMMKFVFKEPVIPDGADKAVFLLAPFVLGVLALSAWAVIPVAKVGKSPTSMSVFSIFSRFPRSAFTASLWGAGHRTPNIRFSPLCARRRK